MGYWIKNAIMAAAVILIGMFIRSWYESSTWLEEGAALRSKGEAVEAIYAFRRSASWAVPFVPSSDDALEELLDLSGDDRLTPEHQLLALQEAKRGLSASRGFLDPLFGRSARLESVTRRLREREFPGGTQNLVREVNPPRVRYGFQWLAQLGFLGWVGAVLCGIWRGLAADGSVRSRPLLIAAVSCAVFFCVWIIALRLA